MIRYFETFFLIAFLAFLSACAPKKQEVEKRYFWPPFSDEPKIEYIDYYQSDYDFEKKRISALEEAVFGREKPAPIFLQPFDVHSSGAGKLYVSEPVEGVVHAIDTERGVVSALKNKKGRLQLFKMPMGLCGDKAGRVYVVDSRDSKVLVFGPDGKLSRKWFLKGIQRPVNIAIDDSREVAYVASPDDHQVFMLALDGGGILEVLGSRGEEAGQFNFPIDVDVDKDGNLYVLDSINARVQVFNSEGEFVRKFGERGTALGSFRLPKAIAVSPSGHVYVTDSLAHKMVVFDAEGNFLTTIGGQAPAIRGGVSPGGFYLPQGLDVDENDAIWVVDTLNRMVHRFQYVTDGYLELNPILPGQAVLPEMNRSR